MDIKLCEHRFGNGKVCRNYTLNGQNFCRHHMRYNDRHDITSPDYIMPDLEDNEAVQLFLNEAIRGMLSGKLDPKQGRSIIWGAMVASGNLRALAKQNEAAHRVALSSRVIADAVNSLRHLVVGSGPDAGRTFGELLQAKLDAVNSGDQTSN
jgi:hypothetical protein